MNILLGVSGSISAYRAYDLLRYLRRGNHRVRIILTAGAKRFVISEVFHYLGAEAVYSDDSDFRPASYPANTQVLHVELGKWANIFCVAPLSANTLARLVRGEASDLLSSVFLAAPSHLKMLFFPAMNSKMLTHPFTEENLKFLTKLSSLKNTFIFPPAQGLLACGDEGEGKLPPVEEMGEIIMCHEEKSRGLEGQDLLITTGATESPLDPIRYLSNSSSGITGFYLAKEALQRGARVSVVAGKSATEKLDYLLPLKERFQLKRVRTPSEMARETFALTETSDFIIAAAAVGDIVFSPDDSFLPEKKKKSDLPSELKIYRSTDILAELLKRKNRKRVVSFALETKAELFREKWERKPAGLMIGTLFQGQDSELQGTRSERASYMIFREGESVEEKRIFSKEEIATKICQYCEEINDKSIR